MADWFSQNAPAQQQSSGDWFSANAPATQQKEAPGFMSNLGTSAVDFAKGIGNTVMHPMDTLRGVGALAGGVAESIYPGALGDPAKAAEAKQALGAVKQHYLDRYGGLSNIAHTAYTDPVGMAADASTVLGGASAVLRGASAIPKLGGLAKAAEVAQVASDASNPLSAVGLVRKGVSTAIAPAKRAAAESMYGSALKPRTTLTVPQRKAVVGTGLREGIPVSEAGYEQAAAKTDELNQQIADVIDRGRQLGPTIDPTAVANRVEQARPGFAAQVNPQADLAALDRSKAEFLAKHTPAQPPPPPPTTLYGPNGKPLPQAPAPPPPKPSLMTVPEAQAEKQGTYRQLRKKYGELGSADVESQKALARGLKEEIVDRYPELTSLNAQDSEMINLERELSRFVGRHANKNMLGLIPAVAGAAAHGPAGAAAKMLGVMALDNPAVKSRIAIALSRSAKSAAPTVSGPVSRTLTPVTQATQAAIPQFARGGVVVPSDAGNLGRMLSQKGFGRKGDALHSGNHPHARQAASLIQKSSPGVKMHPASGHLDNLDPSNGILGHIHKEMAEYLQRPNSRRVIVSTHDGPSPEVHRIAPGHKGKWQAAPIDLSKANHLRQGIYLVRHPAPGKSKASKEPEKPMPNGLRPLQRLS